MKLTIPQALRKKSIEDLRNQIEPLKTKLNSLINNCDHAYDGEPGKWGKCVICGANSSTWYCPNSPDCVCDYKQPDGSYDYDDCVYCHFPSDRN